MTTAPTSTSLQVPEASSPTSTSASIVHTPPSEASGSRSPNPPVPSPPSRRPSPLNLALPGARRQAYRKGGGGGSSARVEEPSFSDNGDDSGEGEEDDMAGRPPMHRPSDGRSQQPLLYKDEGVPPYHSSLESPRPLLSARRSTFRSITPADQDNAMSQTRRKYTYAGFFLLLSLVSFVIQTETAVHIQQDLGWKKAYSMLWVFPFRNLAIRADWVFPCPIVTLRTAHGRYYGQPHCSSSAYKNAKCPGRHSGADMFIFCERRLKW